MRRLTEKEKKEITAKAKVIGCGHGWCGCDDCLLVLASLVLDAQLRIK